MKRAPVLLLTVVAALQATASEAPPLPGTAPLTPFAVDPAAAMVAGIGRYLDRQIAEVAGEREDTWKPDYTDAFAYERSVAPNRSRFIRMIGAVDPRIPSPEMELIATTDTPAVVAETDRFTAYAVRWPVLDGVHGEGLLLWPKLPIRGRVVAVPDADQTPEQIAGLARGLPPRRQFARRLAESGCIVVIPVLLDRSDRFSTTAAGGLHPNLPHREWIYRQAYVLGRHPIGFEVEKIESAVDWLSRQNPRGAGKLGVAGWGEGALLAFYSAAVDRRIDASVVSGYFDAREAIENEPVYRNVFGLLREFGDAELARLVVPRTLIIEEARAPEVAGPPPPRPHEKPMAAPGRITTPDHVTVQREVARAQRLSAPYRDAIACISQITGKPMAPFDDATLEVFLRTLSPDARLLPLAGEPSERRAHFDPADRQRRQVEELGRYCQSLIAPSRTIRDAYLWNPVKPTTPEAWATAMKPYRDAFWNDLIGRIQGPHVAANAATRQIYDRPGWSGYEVKLDVLPDVFAYGYLLVPKPLVPGKKYPVVVAQHGLEDSPAELMNENRATKAFLMYGDVGRRLVERGFVVFLPQNPYRGGDAFRHLQRKANPIKESLFSFIIEQHAQILDWLGSLPWVDRSRIGFYGLSYGGKTALRVPAVLDGYCLSICTGDFNEWVWKVATTDWSQGYPFKNEYEMAEFGLADTFSHAEMTALIAPRPFMVERGHDDQVGLDEWVAFEYARVRRLYDKLGIGDRTRIEFFNGPHQMHLVGSLDFLQEHLQGQAR